MDIFKRFVYCFKRGARSIDTLCIIAEGFVFLTILSGLKNSLKIVMFHLENGRYSS